MKKWISILLSSMACIALLSGCNGVKQTTNKIELGSKVNLLDYMECKEGYSAKIKQQDNAEIIDTMKIGSYDIPFIITDSNGKETEEIFTFQVVDTTAPEIKTEDKLIFPKGIDFDASKLIDVTDLSGHVDITYSPEIDTNKAGDYSIKVTAVDDSGNKTTKDIDVTIMERSETSFRNAVWGDNADLIKSLETAHEIGEGDDGDIIFEGKVCGYDATIAYFIDPSYGFYQGGYMFELPNRPAATLYIEDYNKVKENLIKVYGEPDFVGEPNMINDAAEFINNDNHSLLMGYIGYASEWNIPEKNLNVRLVLYGESFQMNLIAGYTDTRYVDNRDYTEGL